MPAGPPTRVAIKVDVCTAEGLRRGVPRLLDLLARTGLRASFFVTFGPDRSGLLALRLLEPGILRKLFRTRALSLYGWRTALSGTLLPARLSGSGHPDLVRRIRDEGHEVGLHGWDHRLWRDRIDRLKPEAVREEVGHAFLAFEKVLGEPPHAFAAPAWRGSRAALEAIDWRGLDYTSNTRGGGPFYPTIDGLELHTLEIPTTLRCPEEILAQGASPDPYQDRCHGLWPGVLNVFPAHAEVEGHPRFLESFRQWIERRKEAGAEFILLRDAAREAASHERRPPPRRPLVEATITGRPGSVLTGWPEELAAPPAGSACPEDEA